MSEVTYRAAAAGDATALAALRWQMEAERHDVTVALDEYTAQYRGATHADLERGTHRAWLTEVDGRPIACVLLICWNMPPNFTNPHRKRGFVSSVFTAPAFRRQGIARQLMAMLVEHARSEGIQRLILWSSDMGRPLYESLGFAPSRGLELDV